MSEEKKYAINPNEVEIEYQKLALHMNYGGSKYLPRLMKRAFTLSQARLALALDMKTEEMAELLELSEEEVKRNIEKLQILALSKKLGTREEEVHQDIKYMFELGFAFPTRRGWRWARTADQAKDSQSNPKYDEKLGHEYFDLWEAFLKIEAYPTSYYQRQVSLLNSGEPPSFRIIPARKSLQKIENRIPEDNLEEVLKLYSVIAVEHCPCKRLVRDRSCKSPTEVCLIMDRVAEHNLRRGAARVISIEEALEIHDKAGENGLVCMPQSNEARPTRLTMICHCHWCCCDPTASTIMMGFPLERMIAPSCYQAVVDSEKCRGCQICVSRCQFGAIEMKPDTGSDNNVQFKASVNADKCFGCGLCVITCPADARTMKMVRSSETIPKELPPANFYTGTEDHKSGKHVDTGSVMTRPRF
ncbi:MAG: 4Fe-4S binding protein [Syntrophales bacterium]|nr:4Fe-4S binding protein [Syntrophales bacterium]MDY0043299.1 4Fe-4S binding protein [Syntrophales bacterium]